ncbi:MAG: Mov34/MPN/PAD-1 family protein [Thermoplasmatales archaeon]|nr:Mov34/MPN/PAD-1 family protein [Thermoplasmatales archaeon]
MFRRERKRTSDYATKLGAAPRAITRQALDSAMASGRSSYPNEFGGLLRADPPGIISELLLLPGTTAGRRHANFQFYMMPADLAVVGTVHSHPSGAIYPSDADTRLFRNWGRRHVIIGTPFGSSSWRAYDSNGRPVEIPVLGADGRPEGPPTDGRPVRSVHRPD